MRYVLQIDEVAYVTEQNLRFPESTKGWQPESCQPARKSRIT
jgi:hypothetical protein